MRRHNDRTLYVVTWDEAGIIKIGFTDHLRRRQKAFLGARLVLALTFPTSLIGYDFEIAANRAAFAAWPRAFAKREDAYPYIDDIAHGFLECYRATPADALELIASQCHVTIPGHIVTTHCDSGPDRHNVSSRSYGRTDGLTETGGFRDGKIFRYVTRTRASRFLRLAGIGGTR